MAARFVWTTGAIMNTCVAESKFQDPSKCIVGPCVQSLAQYMAMRTVVLRCVPDLFEGHVLREICEMASNHVELSVPCLDQSGTTLCARVTGPRQFYQGDPALWSNPLTIKVLTCCADGNRVHTCECGKRIQCFVDMYRVGREPVDYARECGFDGCMKHVCVVCFDDLRKQCKKHGPTTMTEFLEWRDGPGGCKIEWGPELDTFGPSWEEERIEQDEA